LTPKRTSAHWSGGRRLRCARHPTVDFIAKRHKVDGLGQQRLGAAFQSFSLGLVIAIVIIMTGTSGRSAFAFGESSRPLIPGMLMSDKITINDAPAALLMR
jgi:hypothetical protein